MYSRLLNKGKAFAAPVFLAAGSATLAVGSQMTPVAHCSDDHIPSLDYGWSHHGALASFDYKSVRRGFQVYRQVCASCHSVKEISFRNLVGTTHDEAGTCNLCYHIYSASWIDAYFNQIFALLF